ncbi:helix-turn-helix domain-containing protein [Streptomyces sp. NEAU-YJ-81]|uniref:helix-turn-helix domain-containing protein n=1 Tax=Streptomyces sp. NEAU-YJ-81 TaxID=2820288 RepID=UPI001ABC1079|nr:helix-turn-helix transcriptional regulator [Streptomyces sp. NEAU-YJ-81]MBO3682719.1 helix-turn-helix transcriptional regulator [Streptomyces sp. NEAU-YJ-81]
MPQTSTALGDNVRAHRRRAGMSQEQLASDADLSVSVIRKIEQGGHARVETLHAIARAMGVETAALFATDAPQPVVGDEANRQMLAQLRRALMPPVGITETLSEPGRAEDLSDLGRRIEDGHALYHADRYDSVARLLPRLLRSAEASVLAAEDDEGEARARALHAQALLLTGKYLTQVRQYDMAYHALAEGIRVAREAGQTLSAATGVIGMCWLLLRQDRFGESERLAAVTAEQVEPRVSSATPGELAAWGELSLRIASAAVRNNRPDEAAEARRMAASAATALDQEHIDYRTHWTTFGPVTAELKAVEDLAIAGDVRGVLRRADEGLLAQKALRKFGKPSANNWDRHRLDVARAHVTLGCTQDAMDELNRLKRSSGHWLKHQPMARYIMRDMLTKRKRSLTRDMRSMAAHLDIHA